MEHQTGDDPATPAWKASMLPTYTTGAWSFYEVSIPGFLLTKKAFCH